MKQHDRKSAEKISNIITTIFTIIIFFLLVFLFFTKPGSTIFDIAFISSIITMAAIVLWIF